MHISFTQRIALLGLILISVWQLSAMAPQGYIELKSPSKERAKFGTILNSMGNSKKTDIEIIQEIAKTPELLSAKTNIGYTLLMGAAQYGRPEIVKYILANQGIHGINSQTAINQTATISNQTYTALSFAARFNRSEAVETLLESNPSKATISDALNKTKNNPVISALLTRAFETQAPRPEQSRPAPQPKPAPKPAPTQKPAPQPTQKPQPRPTPQSKPQPAQEQPKPQPQPQQPKPEQAEPSQPKPQPKPAAEPKIKPDLTANPDMSPRKVLGVSVYATPEEIKKVYKRYALLYHPDKFDQNSAELAKQGIHTREEAANAFAKISSAYAILR